MNTQIEVKEYSKDEAIQYMKDNTLTKKRWYYNVYGWSTYYTLKPTFATPTGKAKGFPRCITIIL